MNNRSTTKYHTNYYYISISCILDAPGSSIIVQCKCYHASLPSFFITPLVGRELAQLPDLRSIDEVNNRDREQCHATEGQQTRRPRNAEALEHLRREERECSSNPGPEERVCGNGAVGVHLVHIDEVVQPLQEDHHDTHPDRSSGYDLRPRCDRWITRPAEPEESYRQNTAADDHGDESLFGNDVAFFLHDFL
jgi:hypothetical protein